MVDRRRRPSTSTGSRISESLNFPEAHLSKSGTDGEVFKVSQGSLNDWNRIAAKLPVVERIRIAASGGVKFLGT